VDLIGAGDSDKLPDSGPGSYGFAEHAHYLGALLDSLELGDEVVLVGHDWGEWDRIRRGVDAPVRMV
jgi:haloalkane dehalogenase